MFVVTLSVESMSLNEDNIKLIFGLKLKQFRTAKKLSLTELAEKAGLSVSYINEIEKGKKYPKAEKISTLANVLDVPYDKLVSLKLDKQLAPVGEILNSRLLEELPLDLFGIDKGKLIEIIASAPSKVTAFISTIAQISSTYNLTQENFYFAMLRSYQEMHENYFEELEKEADRFRKEYDLPASGNIPSEVLRNILLDQFGYRVEENDLNEFPELTHIRSVFIEDAKKILINAKMAENQKAFLYAKELGYQFLEMSGERALMTPWPRATSFDHVLNNSRASYFAGALLISPDDLVAQLEPFFASKKWNGDALFRILETYNSSPEMFMLRLINIIPKYFGLSGMFFMRFDHKKEPQETSLKKQLHLSRTRNPKKITLLENYCRAWADKQIFNDLGKSPKAYCHRFETESHNQRFFVMALSRPMKRNPNAALSVMIGFEENTAFAKKIGFAEDSSIETTVMAIDKAELLREEEFKNIRSAMKALMESQKSTAVSELTD
ncbi:MAG: helix-turn-helix domain-containing protein [Flavobacteriales bacterium]|nr:helix-turn-helix domain-containing protein [Flavobacteriales bacterium]